MEETVTHALPFAVRYIKLVVECFESYHSHFDELGPQNRSSRRSLSPSDLRNPVIKEKKGSSYGGFVLYTQLRCACFFLPRDRFFREQLFLVPCASRSPAATAVALHSANTQHRRRNAIQSSNWLWRVASLNFISQPFLTSWIAVLCIVFSTQRRSEKAGYVKCVNLIVVRNVLLLLLPLIALHRLQKKVYSRRSQSGCDMLM